MLKRNGALAIAVLYTLSGILWIALSDRAVFFIYGPNQSALIQSISSIKGFLYVIITGVLLFLLIRTHNRHARQIEKQYRKYFTDNPDPMWAYDRSTFRFMDVNDAAIAHYGYSREEFLSMTILDIRPDEEIEQLKKTLASRHESALFDAGIWKHRKKNGTLIYVHITSHPLTATDNEQVMVMSKDITESTLYQKKLQQSNEDLNQLNKALSAQKKLLSDVQTIARLGGWEYYPANQKMVRSDEIYYILDFAYPTEEDPMQNLINHIHPDDKEEFLGWKHEMETLGTGVDNVFRIINDNGQLKYLHMVAETDLRNGVPYRIKGSLQDITASKQKDLQLQRALERYDLIARATNDMFYEYDMVNNTVTYSRDFDNITNPIFLNEKDPTKAWFAIVHPDDISRMIETNQRTIREHKHIYTCEYRVDFGVNDYRYVCDQVYIQYENNQPVRMLGAIRDINDLKRTAEENKRLSSVISMVHNMVLITDTGRRIQWVNRAFEQVSGYTLAELKDNLPQLLIGGPSLDPAIVSEILERSTRQEIFYMELPFYSRNGKLTWTYADFSPLYNEKQEYIGYTTVYVDISMLKEKEASLLNQNTTLREIAWLESHEMRRPLSSILGLVELIRISNDEVEKKELFELLDICAKEMDSMVLKISKKIQEGMKK